MMREWLVVREAEGMDEDDLIVRHIVQGVFSPEGNVVAHGHTFSADCDCRPRIENALDVVLVIHRWDC